MISSNGYFSQVDIISNRDGEEGEEKAIFGIFIKNVVADSPAGRCGELKVSPEPHIIPPVFIYEYGALARTAWKEPFLGALKDPLTTLV